MDIQPVTNEHKALNYMCAYLSKSEERCFQALSLALQESIEKKKCNYEQINAVALYHCLLELRLRKIFARVIYANTNLAEKRLKMLPSQ